MLEYQNIPGGGQERVRKEKDQTVLIRLCKGFTISGFSSEMEQL